MVPRYLAYGVCALHIGARLAVADGHVQRTRHIAPTMGWSSWYAFALQINETRILATAGALKDAGFLEAGYTYINLDDAWSGPLRDPKTGQLMGDPLRFPHGMAWLAETLHGMGFRFGLYGNAGPTTCAGYPGQFQHEYQDAATFAEWGVDFFKYDNCQNRWDQSALNIRGVSFDGEDAVPLRVPPGGGAWGEEGELVPWWPLPNGSASFAPRLTASHFQVQDVEAYKLMGQALMSTGRRIVYNICPRIAGCDPSIWKFYAGVADTCMMQCPQHDVRDAWEGLGRYGQNNPNSSVLWHWDNVFEYGINEAVGPGWYHDPDMLMMGSKTIAHDCSFGADGYCGGQTMSKQEYRSQFALWSLLAAPLTLSFDPTAPEGISDDMRAVLLNPDIIAIDQDPLTLPVRRVAVAGGIEVLVRGLSGERLAVALLNRNSNQEVIQASWSEVGWASDYAMVRDCWAREDLGLVRDGLEAAVQAHDTLVFVLSRTALTAEYV